MNKTEWISLLKGAGIAAAGAALAVVVQWAQGTTDASGPIIGAVASVLVNVLRKWQFSEPEKVELKD